MNIKESAQSKIHQLRRQIGTKGFITSSIEQKNYNYEFLISKGNEKLKLQLYFGKKGLRIVIQGNNETNLFKQIQNIVFDQKSLDFQEKSIDEPSIYIGSDESGKGDAFGPLVIAAFYSTKECRNSLLKLGVKDSKELNDYQISRIGKSIADEFPDNFEILIIDPEYYNDLYDKFKNLNSLLTWGHTEVINSLLERKNCSEAIIDKFSNKPLTLRKNLKEEEITITQTTKAERFIGVAAASILARVKVVEWFESNHLGLPKGASGEVDKVIKNIMDNPEIEMKNIAKLHFKNVKRCLIK